MTITPFAPPLNQPFQFQPTLDGETYTGIIPWNVYGQRWYLDIVTLAGRLICSVAIVGSPDGYDINLVKGYFTSSAVVYRASTNSFEVMP